MLMEMLQLNPYHPCTYAFGNTPTSCDWEYRTSNKCSNPDNIPLSAPSHTGYNEVELGPSDSYPTETVTLTLVHSIPNGGHNRRGIPG